MNNFNVSTLSNGITVVSEFIPYVKSFSLGLWFDVGPRDENRSNNGISHFIEHMLFKGTKKRTARRISDEIESYGGYLNAFTSKEITCFYGRGLAGNFSRTFRVLADMAQNPLFKDLHIRKESGVVVDELLDINDNPEELIFDKFEEEIYSGNTLSYPIIGTEKNILSFNSDVLHNFHQNKYRTDNLLIAVSGHINHEDAVKMADKLFVRNVSRTRQRRKSFAGSKPSEKIINKEVQQVHSIIGRPTYGTISNKRIKLKILSTLLGDGSSSRLFQAIREKLGITYQINTFLNSYKDVSSFGVYFSTSEKQVDRVNNIILKEFEKLKSAEVKDKELKRVKEYIKGNTILSLENTTNRMIRIASSYMNFGRIIPVDEFMKKIDAVTSADIISLSNELLNERELTKVILKSENNRVKKAA